MTDKRFCELLFWCSFIPLVFLGVSWVLTGYVLPIHAPGVLAIVLATAAYFSFVRLVLTHRWLHQ